MVGAVVSVSPGDVVTVVRTVVNNISGAVTNIEFPYLWSIETNYLNNFEICSANWLDIQNIKFNEIILF